ncbi:hypothetical protein [Rhizobium giardinii]|uniref:hypothetical protein n=1 Tax=Rhizobium giardinii TaxID=56731 RepID=UPI003D6FD01F
MLDPFDICGGVVTLSTGAPLVEIGDLEIVADLLSIDAVRSSAHLFGSTAGEDRRSKAR